MTSFPYISLLDQEGLGKVKLVKPFQILYGTDAAWFKGLQRAMLVLKKYYIYLEMSRF